MAPRPEEPWYPPLPRLRDPEYVGHKPDYNQAWTVDVLPTTTKMPEYTNLPTISWNSGLAASAVSAYSSYVQSELDSAFTATSYPPRRDPVSASDTPVYTPIPKKGISGAVLGIVAAIAVLAIVFILVGICLVMCRKSRKNKVASNRNGARSEMVQTNGNQPNAQYAETRAYIGSPSTERLPALTSSSATTTSSQQNLTMPEAPVLLSTTMDHSYYTGIDTSDGLSLHETRRLSTATATPGYASSTISEPPPPYRPMSVMSRDNSCRYSVAPPSYGPRLSVRSTNMAPVASPFDDPEDDSPVAEHAPSPIIGTSHMRDMEEMSDVSELSYQEDPVIAHSPA